MSKRFGRNQRRQMREALAATKAAHSYAVDRYTESEQMMAARETRLKAEHLKDIEAARMARDTIRIDVDSLIDERERNIGMRARFENMSLHATDIYSAVEIGFNDVMQRSDRERHAFVELIGRRVAEHALAQIMRHWRSR